MCKLVRCLISENSKNYNMPCPRGKNTRTKSNFLLKWSSYWDFTRTHA